MHNPRYGGNGYHNSHHGSHRGGHHGGHHGHHGHHGGHHHHHGQAPQVRVVTPSDEAKHYAQQHTPRPEDVLARAAASPADFVYYVITKPRFGAQFSRSSHVRPHLDAAEWRSLEQDARQCQVLSNLRELFAQGQLCLSEMSDDMLNDFCYHQHGTRVVQLALQESPRAEQAKLVQQLSRGLHYDPRAVAAKKSLFEDANANHVVAAKMTFCHQSTLEGTLDHLYRSRMGHQARHNFACRYLQRLLENTSGQTRINAAWAILTDSHPEDLTLVQKPYEEQQGQLAHHVHTLCADSYGCYVAQSVYTNLRASDMPDDFYCQYLMQAMEYSVLQYLEEFVKQKNCARVLERLIQLGPRQPENAEVSAGFPIHARSAQHAVMEHLFDTQSGSGVDTLFCKLLAQQDRSLAVATMRCLQMMHAMDAGDVQCNEWRRLAREAIAHVRSVVETSAGVSGGRGGQYRGHY